MKKVLIVEDSVFISNAIRILLEDAGIRAEVETDSTKAEARLRRDRYDLVILDLMMPVVNGKEIFHIMKEDNDLKNIPVIILTARTDALKWDPDLAKCDKFITKPFDNKELAAGVKELLSK